MTTEDTASAEPHPIAKNRHGWTPERRAKHRAAIMCWKPWEKSTGPRSARGKSMSSRNAYKHGARGAVMLEFRRALSAQARWLRAARLAIRSGGLKNKFISPNELLGREVFCGISPPRFAVFPPPGVRVGIIKRDIWNDGA